MKRMDNIEASTQKIGELLNAKNVTIQMQADIIKRGTEIIESLKRIVALKDELIESQKRTIELERSFARKW